MRILGVADTVSPVIYSDNFPGNLPSFDLTLAAGDLPGDYLEFIATRTDTPPLFVFGNHALGYLRDEDGSLTPPGGCIDAHLKVVTAAGLRVLGVEGSARYRDGPHQYSERQFSAMLGRLWPRLLWLERRHGLAVDVLLTHAPPVGPHAGEDHAHRGIPAFNEFHKRWRPRLHLHGHVHLSGANAPREYESPEGVRVVNAYDFALVEL